MKRDDTAATDYQRLHLSAVWFIWCAFCWIALRVVYPRVRDLLGPALVVSPVSCFEGLPERASDGYVIGAVAGSHEEAELLVEGAGEPVLFTAYVTIVCPD